MKKINLVLCGCLGRMGMEFVEVAESALDLRIVAGISRIENKGREFPIFRCFDDLGKLNINFDVILDFSHPSVLSQLLEFATDKSVPVVICTTGYSETQLAYIKQVSEIIPVFLSSNTSLGVNVLVEIIKIAKKLLGRGFDIEIIEKHHNHKLDAPSGTALMLADKISEKNTKYVYDRTSYRRARERNEIGIHTVRCGGINGEHEVIFASDYETLTLKHTANSRKVFAYGALSAINFIINKPAGFYTMKDVLGIYD